MDKTAKIAGIGIFLLVLVSLIYFFISQASLSSGIEKNDILNLSFDENTTYTFIPIGEGYLGSLGIQGWFKGDYCSVGVLQQTVYSFGDDRDVFAEVISSGSGELDIKFEYGSDPSYDINNDGLTSVDGVIDFRLNIEKKQELMDDKLCSKYIIANEDYNSTVCYGNADCCSFLNLESSGNYNDSFFLSYGKYGAGFNNTVLAQAVYFDVDLSPENIHSNIYASDIQSLPAVFVDDIFFDISKNMSFDKKYNSYDLDIVLEGKLIITNLSYTLLDNKPTLVITNSSFNSDGWQIIFRTYGTSDLKIIPLEDTSFAELMIDNDDTENDLKIKKIFCGENYIFDSDNDIFNLSSIVLNSGSVVSLNDLINSSFDFSEFLVSNYSCSEETKILMDFIKSASVKLNLSMGYNSVSVEYTKESPRMEITAAPDVVYTNSSFGNDLLFTNATESSNLGARLSAPVLFMDFNTPPETNTDGNITYVQDNSLYNSWGTLR
jgi:hypothetical protein